MPALWAVVGATGVGKSEYSLALAERLTKETVVPAEIVNADAMQLYHGMDIGTAKLSVDERRGIRHHLFDVLEPTEEAAVAQYQPEARTIISQAHESGADVILVGGSGLYVSSVLFDFQFPPRDPEIRARLEAELEARGIDPLIEQLEQIAPETAAAVDRQNPRRVVRALEVAMLGGDAQVTLPQEPTLWSAGPTHTNTHILGLSYDRALLVERLDARVTKMWESGMLDEVRALIPRGIERGKTASQAIGYAQALAQLRGTMTEAEAIAETQRLTRRYARRQVSWFKRYPGITWIDAAANGD